MNHHEILTKLSGFKENFLHLFNRKGDEEIIATEEKEELEPYHDDLPLTLNRGPGPGITFYPTENSEFSRGLNKEIPRGIDHF